MPLVSIKPILTTALSQHYAVVAFNPVDFSSMRAVIAAAELENAPVILQISEKTVCYYDHVTIVQWARLLGDRTRIPVALHLDHGKDLQLIRDCIETGWTSVMIDASDKPYAENLALTHEVMEMAKTREVGVEAEIGQIGGIEEDLVVTEKEAHLCDPDEAESFCRALPGLAVLAPACGTAHGYYKGTPNVAFDLLSEISRRTGMPLALHGGTGLSDEVIKKCIKRGCSKVNISTNLKHTFVDGFCQYHQDHPDDYEPLNLLRSQHNAMVEMARNKIRVCGSNNRA